MDNKEFSVLCNLSEYCLSDPINAGDRVLSYANAGKNVSEDLSIALRHLYFLLFILQYNSEEHLLALLELELSSSEELRRLVAVAVKSAIYCKRSVRKRRELGKRA